MEYCSTAQSHGSLRRHLDSYCCDDTQIVGPACSRMSLRVVLAVHFFLLGDGADVFGAAVVALGVDVFGAALVALGVDVFGAAVVAAGVASGYSSSSASESTGAGALVVGLGVVLDSLVGFGVVVEPLAGFGVAALELPDVAPLSPTQSTAIDNRQTPHT